MSKNAREPLTLDTCARCVFIIFEWKKRKTSDSPSNSFHMDIFYTRREQRLDVVIMMDDNNNSWNNVHNEKSLSDNDVLLLNEHPI